MAKYIYKHRRGTTEQWNDCSTTIPYEGEIVIEFDDVNNLHKLKIGDGKHTYEDLAYLQAGDEIVTQVLAEVKPRIVTVELAATWNQDVEGKYSQPVDIDNITLHSRLDLQPSADMLAEFKQLGLVFVTENKGGIITIYSVGNMPSQAYTMQATVVETECEGEHDSVVGVTVGAPAVQADWNQTDETKADYIKNKPIVNRATPQMYGAKGDGVTDDTAAFGLALSSNSSVFLPEGVYNISSTLDITSGKCLYSDSGGKATIRFTGSTGDIVLLGEHSKFLNIDIDIPNYMAGNVFNTDNRLLGDSTCFLHTLVSGVDVMVRQANSGAEDKDLTIINIVASNQTGAEGFCYQTYSNINVLCPDYYYVDHYVDRFAKYSNGIKILLTADEEVDTLSWITHLNFENIYLGGPLTAIRVGHQNNTGIELTSNNSINHIMMTNVSTQVNINYSERFLDLDHCKICSSNLKSWDYKEYAVYKPRFNRFGKNVKFILGAGEVPPIETTEFTEEEGYNLVDYHYLIGQYFVDLSGLTPNGFNDPRTATKLSGINGPNIDEITNNVNTKARNPELDSPSIYRLLGAINVGTESAPVKQSGTGLQFGTGAYYREGGHMSKQLMITNDNRIYFRQYYKTTDSWQPWLKVYTETDKQELIDLVIASLPVYNGEVEYD